MWRALAAGAVFLIFAWLVLPLNAQGRRGGQASSAEWTYTPPSAQKSVEIGNFYLRKKDYRGALSRFQEAIRTDPEYAPAYDGLGKVYDATGRKEEALLAYLKYLYELPSDTAAEHAKDAHRAIARLKRQLTPAQVKAAELAARTIPRH